MPVLCTIILHEACSSSKVSPDVQEQSFVGHIVDIEHKEIYPGEIRISDNLIDTIIRLKNVTGDAPYYLPGFTDSHIHIESSMMIPENFAKVAVKHGVVNAICDPHEITNVLGVERINFMIENSKNSRFNFYFGLPSCVPSSHLETAGAIIDATTTQELIKRNDIYFLAEMMNYPGVISGDNEVLGKITAAKNAGKKIDGHAPGVTGNDLLKYAAAGISTDHECSTLTEAQERIANGMKVIVREGSAARNFDALFPIIAKAPDMVMLCSDDKHPDDLIDGHIDALVRRGLTKNLSVWDILKAACINPVKHYGIPSELMRKGDKATFIAVDNLSDFNIVTTVIDGHKVFDRSSGIIDKALKTGNRPVETPNNFNARSITADDIAIDTSKGYAKVIVALDGELITLSETIPVSELENTEIQKIVVYNRYGNGLPQVGFIKGFNLKQGALGATIAHDSHNIVAIGTSDKEIALMINALIESKGGVGVVYNGVSEILPLPIAGLMSKEPAEIIAEKYQKLNHKAKEMKCTLKSPFITMSFMALPVIPELKLTDKGLVDVKAFDFTDVITQ